MAVKRRSERTIRTAERDRLAAAMRVEGASYDTIAAALGYYDRGHARRGSQRAINAVSQEVGDELRVLELERLDRWSEAAVAVLKKKHVAHSNGRVITLDGQPLEDDGPVLAAIDRLLKIQERRAKLHGLDAPTKHEVRTIGAIEAEVAELERQLADRDRAAGDVR